MRILLRLFNERPIFMAGVNGVYGWWVYLKVHLDYFRVFDSARKFSVPECVCDILEIVSIYLSEAVFPVKMHIPCRGWESRGVGLCSYLINSLYT